MESIPGNPTEQERQFIIDTIPTLAEAVRGGTISDSAKRKLKLAREDQKRRYRLLLPKSQQENLDWDAQGLGSIYDDEKFASKQMEAALDRAIDAQEKALGRELRDSEIDRLAAQLMAGSQ